MGGIICGWSDNISIPIPDDNFNNNYSTVVLFVHLILLKKNPEIIPSFLLANDSILLVSWSILYSPVRWKIQIL